MATLTVGAGKQFATIAAATAAARDGDTVAVSAGTYVNDFAVVRSRISLTAVGGAVTMTSTYAAAPAKALLTVTADATIDGFSFTNMRTADGAGAGVLVQAGAVTVKNSVFTGNQNGLLATANAATTVTVQSSEFARNGNNDGFSANIQAGAIKALTVRDSTVHDAAGTAEVRSRAAATIITGTRIQDNTATAGLLLDLPAAGAVSLVGNTLQKGAASTVAALVRYGGESVQAGSSFAASGNTILSDRSGAVLLQNVTAVAASLASNVLWGVATVASGPAVQSANTVAGSRPGTVAPAAPVAAAEPGRAGAVVATGRVLTVGQGKQFATLGAAVAAAADGDTIAVSAGTYVNDGAIIARKVIIEGLDGTARFVSTTTPAGGAVFVVRADATLRNIEVFGAATPGGVAAAIDVQGGTLVVVNSSIHDNQAGIVAEAGAGTVAIYDTEIARNGTADGRGTNVAVGAIDSLVLRNDSIHDAVAAPEVTSHARTTVLDADRIKQTTAAAVPVVSLPDAGQVTITSSAVERGAGASTAPVVQVGGGTAQPGSAVVLGNDTLITGKVAGATTFVANAAPSASVAVSGSTFVGGAAGSVQVAGGTNTGARTGTALAVNTTAPNGPTAALDPAALTVSTSTVLQPAQPGQLVLRVSGLSWHGDAQYTLKVDGVAVGGTLSATASHAAGQSQLVTIAGAFAPGPHVVSVSFVNSLGAGADQRAVYVDAMTFNGEDVHQTAALSANGTALLATAPTTRPVPVTVNLSEDAARGDALAFISIDGKVQGGVQTVTASHAAGASMGLSFLPDLAPGAHTASVTFLNAAAGRTLYVDSMDVAGTHYAAAAARLDAGTSTFAFTVAPAPAANGALYVTVGAPQDLAAVLPYSAP